ncbi:MAG TPA: hypothetical protein VF168_04525 [Trueperaceae bacterium]
MLKLEHVALELFEFKVEEVRARRRVRGGLSGVWELYHHLQRHLALLDPEERRRLELAERTLRRVSETGQRQTAEVADFSELTLAGDGETEEALDPEVVTTTAIAAPGTPEAAEQAALQRLAGKVWRYDLNRFIRRLASGLRAERDRNTARLLYAAHRNLHAYASSEACRGDAHLQRFEVSEAIPSHDDPFFSSTDVDSLGELVRETIDCALRLADPHGPFRQLGVRPGDELETLHNLVRKVAADPYAGRSGLLEQKGPSAQQLRVAIQELGKEQMRDEERLAQRRQLEERLQRVLAFERHQRQVFHQDVDRFTSLADAFFERLSRYLPRSVGGEAGAPRLPGGVLFAINPALRVENVEPHVSSATIRLKGPTRLKVGGLEVSVSGNGSGQKLYVRGEEHPLADELAISCERKWLHAFREGDYLHFKVEDEGRSIAARVAEAAIVLQVLSSPHPDDLIGVMRALANRTVGETSELVRGTVDALASLTAKAPDRAAAIKGFLQGAARAARVLLSDEAIDELATGLHRAMKVDPSELNELLDEIDLGEMSVHTLTGQPLAIEVASFSLTVRQYRSSGVGINESLVVMLPGQTLGTFDEYLIEPLGDGLLVCVKGEQELVVGYAPAVKSVGSS